MKPKQRPDLFSRRFELRPRIHLTIPPVSLLWPTNPTLTTAHAANWDYDLGLGDLVSALTIDKRYTSFIRQTLQALTTDIEVIAWRQAVMADFVANPDLVQQAQSLLPRLANLRQDNALLGKRQRNLLLETADRLAELDLYTDIVQDLHNALQSAKLESSALSQLLAHLAVLLNDENFQKLRRELPEMRAPLENISSLTVGINLDLELQPVSAVLLAINEHELGESVSLLERLIGARMNQEDESGLASLHHTPQNPEQRPLSPLFQDLDRLLAQVAQPVARALNRYVKTSSSSMVNLEYELAFYLSAAHLFQRLTKQGIALCRPEIANPDERITEIDDLVNINLTLNSSDMPITSPAEFGANGRIAILTGPNSGGKTTYLRAVGLAHVLFQAGLFVPAKTARMSPVDYILTHFPALESRQQGRLAEEAVRLRQIFQQATSRSLILLNETFSSTASSEALYLAQDILCALRAIGVRAIYATHLVELVDQIEAMTAVVSGDSSFFSLVAGIQIGDNGETIPTYQITRSLPLGRSYAREIAKRHGINLQQILESRRPKS